ncbi:hypothetical protein QUF84_25435 [Fictibacillus enclensis]|uniref:hypothetical protein n=1 Tax=Fictibacillus enclensis TaxID=1017270 RepID=UPI0025A1F4F1|nr:hypothetical protein [Fictibacillus enclensis]MDM5340538.1 hypothetical protein [Fictibacillus enclensis]
MSFDVPVAIIIFNRPEETKRIFQEIKNIKPSTLYIISDGPRESVTSDKEKVKACRDIIENEVNWDCDIRKLYSDVNLGCKNRIVSGLNIAFDKEDYLIVLEDDCLPNPSFFWFCREMLIKYKDDKRIMNICGTNYLSEWGNPNSYLFSYYGGIWGWASWKRAWNLNDVTMSKLFNEDTKKALQNVLVDKNQMKIRFNEYKKTVEGANDAWDYGWSLSRLINSGLTIVPSKNLISNIGFGPEATHTFLGASYLSNQKTFEMEFPIQDPDIVVVDREYDKNLFKKLYKYYWIRNAVPKSVKKNIKQILKK